MVIVKRFQWSCVIALVCFSVRAADVSVYKIGEKAQQDITASVPFDVVDAKATAALKTAKAEEIAAIYHQVTGVTNVMASNLLASFANARSGFSNMVAAVYHEPVIDDPTIESSDFGYFVTDYNVEHKNFPVTAELAVAWARGNSGAALRDKWLGSLLQMMDRPVQPDGLPPHFIFHKKIRVMSVTNVNEKFTFTMAWRAGRIMSADRVPALDSVRAKFRREFPEDEQLLAAALSQFLQPDCFPDMALTKQARDYSARQFVVADHFDAGQMIVQRGETIGAQDKAALDAMDKALMPGVLDQQIAAEQQRTQQAQDRAQQAQDRAQQAQDRAQQEQQQAQSDRDAAQLAQQQQEQAQSDRDRAQSQAQQEQQQAAALREQALDAQNLAQKIRARDEWLSLALASVSVLALLILWRLLRRQPSAVVSLPAELQRIEKRSPMVHAELAPFLAQTLKEAVVQELASQRAELLEAQRLAAAEIGELVHRLDQLQAPMHERLQAYQERIQELQRDLAQRTQENRELLKMKIEMMRRQIKTERGRVKFN